MESNTIGSHIAYLRKQKGLTQNELGERLGVSFQAVSKWERDETLPDTAILLDLAHVLETTVDSILSGGRTARMYQGRVSAAQLREGLLCLKRMGELLGTGSFFYRCAIQGIDSAMNTDIEEAFRSENAFEAFLAEAKLQSLMAGKYLEPTDVRNSFQSSHFRQLVLSACDKYGIR